MGTQLGGGSALQYNDFDAALWIVSVTGLDFVSVPDAHRPPAQVIYLTAMLLTVANMLAPQPCLRCGLGCVPSLTGGAHNL
jgi:hypothetical protein